jgi:hypothetical protein
MPLAVAGGIWRMRRLRRVPSDEGEKREGTHLKSAESYNGKKKEAHGPILGLLGELRIIINSGC